MNTKEDKYIFLNGENRRGIKNKLKNADPVKRTQKLARKNISNNIVSIFPNMKEEQIEITDSVPGKIDTERSKRSYVLRSLNFKLKKKKTLQVFRQKRAVY